MACSRTPHSFSPAEQCGWLRVIHAGYSADLEERGRSVEGVRYTAEGVGQLVRVWEREPPETSGECHLLCASQCNAC